MLPGRAVHERLSTGTNRRRFGGPGQLGLIAGKRQHAGRGHGHLPERRHRRQLHIDCRKIIGQRRKRHLEQRRVVDPEILLHDGDRGAEAAGSEML